MRFRTETDCKAFEKQISYGKPIFMLGSCFTDNIGSILNELLFDITINPFGVIYNPESLKNNILALLTKERYTLNDLNQEKELWFSFDHYTKFSDPKPEEALRKINQAFLPAREKLRKASTLLITLGTAWTFRFNENGKIVNNCHKIPAKEFSRQLLSIEDIHRSYSHLLPELRKVNPNIQLIFTVSPVRHIKDGQIENQRSKATLILAIQQICASFPEYCSYFPAYEIMMDDLRDYRFYNEDLIHPNSQAIEYIWEKFSSSLIDPISRQTIQEIKPILNSIKHKALHKNTEAYRRFQENLDNKIKLAKQKYPELCWEKL